MAKIEVEDLTECKEDLAVADLLFEENMVKKAATAYIPVLINDFMQAKLSTKETIYVTFLMGHCMKKLIFEMGQLKPEDLADIDEWANKFGEEYVEELKTNGMLDEIKRLYVKLTENLKKC